MAIDPVMFQEFFGSDGLSQHAFEASLQDFLWNELYHIELVFLYSRTTDLPPNKFDDLISKMQAYFPYTVFDKSKGSHTHTDCPKGDDFFSQADSMETLAKEEEQYKLLLNKSSPSHTWNQMTWI